MHGQLRGHLVIVQRPSHPHRLQNLLCCVCNTT